jgi:hypothetical protein
MIIKSSGIQPFVHVTLNIIPLQLVIPKVAVYNSSYTQSVICL